MADHVGIRDVDDGERVAVAEALGEPLGDAGGRHLGRLVVRGDVAARGDELPVLAGVLLLAPAAEEVRHVRVLLRLGDVQLTQAGGLERVGERAVQRRVVEHDQRIQRVVVARHRREQPERGRERVADLARAVGAEVEEHERIALDDAQPGVAEDDRLHELVGEPGGVARLDGGRGGLGALPHPVDERRARELGALEPVIAIHPVVAPHDRRDRRAGALPLALELREQPGGLVGRDVAAVGEGVDRDARHPGRERRAGDRAQVVDVRVHAAVRDEARDVQDAAPVARRGDGRPQRRVERERAVRHGVADAHQVLRDDAAGSEVEVPDLGVAHLTLGQAHGTTRGDQRGVRIALPERVEHRRASERHGVSGLRGRESEAVEHDERDGSRHQPASAARAIPAKLPGSRQAPPTSAPSTSGCASSEAALSGLTDPP